MKNIIYNQKKKLVSNQNFFSLAAENIVTKPFMELLVSTYWAQKKLVVGNFFGKNLVVCSIIR